VEKVSRINFKPFLVDQSVNHSTIFILAELQTAQQIKLKCLLLTCERFKKKTSVIKCDVMKRSELQN